MTAASSLGAVLLGLAVLAAPPVLAQTLDEARSLARDGDTARALAAVRAVLAARPRDVEARLLRGLLLGRTGRSDEAIAAMRALAEERPDLPEVRNDLAVLYAAQGRYEEAREALLEALRLAPDYAVAHENLGDVYTKLAALAYARAARGDAPDTRVADKRAAAERLVARPALAADTASEAGRTGPAPPRDPPPATGRAMPGVTAPAADARARSCVQVPVPDPRLARQVATWLRARGLDTHVAGDVVAHRVMVPPLASQDATRREVARLQAAGITDLMPIRRGEHANGISLGVYAHEDGARRRVRDLAARGVVARITPHRVNGDADGKTRVVARGDFDPRTFAQAYPDLRFEIEDCPR